MVSVLELYPFPGHRVSTLRVRGCLQVGCEMPARLPEPPLGKCPFPSWMLARSAAGRLSSPFLSLSSLQPWREDAEDPFDRWRNPGSSQDERPVLVSWVQYHLGLSRKKEVGVLVKGLLFVTGWHPSVDCRGTWGGSKRGWSCSRGKLLTYIHVQEHNSSPLRPPEGQGFIISFFSDE